MKEKDLIEKDASFIKHSHMRTISQSIHTKRHISELQSLKLQSVFFLWLKW